MKWTLAAVPLLLAVVLFAPATLGGKVLSASDQPLFEPPFAAPAGERPQNPLQYDAAFTFEPDGLQVRAALREGRLPTWSPDMLAGTPLLATQQSASMFPLTWLGAVFDFFSALAWIAVLKLTLAALGTGLLARALGLGRPAALLAGLSFAFGTYMVDWLMHPHVNAYLMLPWLLLGGERLARTGRVRDGALLAAASGLTWLGGHPQSALLMHLTAIAWLLFRVRGRRPALLAAGAGAAGLALAAIVLVPLAEALGHALETSRAQPPMPLRAAFTLFLPEHWGSPDGAEVAGPSNFTERTLYAGALPLVLAVAGLFARRPDAPQRFFAVLAVVGVAVSWDTGPIASVAGDLPVLSSINITRALVLASFGVALLAGFGLQRLLDGDAAARRRMLLAACAVAALPVVAGMLARPGRLGQVTEAAGWLVNHDGAAGAGVLATASVLRWALLGALAVGVVLATGRGVRGAAWAACALVAVDLLAVNAGYNPAIAREQAEPPTTPALRALQQATAAGGRAIGLQGLQPNTASRWGLRDARGREQPTVRRTIDLQRALGDWFILTGANEPLAAPAARLLDVYGVRAFLVGSPQQAPRGHRILHSGPDGTVVENRSAFPDAYVAYGWRPAPDAEAARALVVDRPRRAVLDFPAIETDDLPQRGPVPAATPARVVGRSETSVTIEADATRPGRLVLHDTFYPGWTATVDGRDVPIEAANGAFRAVAVPAGRHRVRFEYRPASVRWGAVISLATLVLLTLAITLGPRLRD